MPRSGLVKKRETLVDPLYHSRVVTRFINRVMIGGKKSLAKRIVYGALAKLAEDRKEAATKLEEIMKRVMPEVEIRPRRVGGATYQVPVPVRFDRAQALAIRWLTEAAKSKKGKPMEEKLAEELTLALKGEGEAIKKRENVHRMADANKAFAHFKW